MGDRDRPSGGQSVRLLLDERALAARRTIAHAELAPLAESLAADLAPLLDRDLYFPAEKALLSREGGRCARDGALLEFDPFNRHEHRCPVCGTVYRGELHDRFWIYWYQLWLAERAVHAALLSRLDVDARFASLARDILEGYADRYLSYPNVDNVLGPTRLFFSTYLESIWLLQICIAADLFAARDSALVGRVIDRIVAPSRALIALYDEGASNRQVWNDAALLATARLLDDARGAEQAVYGPSGIAAHLSANLLPDGTWYEGENYHLFAHRGLWYGVQMAEASGLELPAALVDRFQLGFSTPFATALPDFTLPSRRDSQYAISLRQWRVAEHCEVGVARRADESLLAALRQMYAVDAPMAAAASTARARASADVERNTPASRLTRADLSWRALLFALPELPPLRDAAPRTALLDSQGIAVFRREHASVYAALDYGHSGGGHGHPDRLNLILATKAGRLLDDFGTGSYVDPSLHWYRSTLAHNAPLFDKRSQLPVHGRLLAYDERDDIGWIAAVADEMAPGASASRTLVVLPEYCIDVVRWTANRGVDVDLPLHVDLHIASPNVAFEARPLAGGGGIEDGFAFARETTVQRVPAATPVVAHAVLDEASVTLFAQSTHDTGWWRASAPGAPSRGSHWFRVLRTHAPRGEHRLVWSWSGQVRDVRFDDAIHVTLADGSEHLHMPRDRGWTIGMHGRHPRTIELGGVVEPGRAATVETTDEAPAALLTLRRSGEPTIVQLAQAHYRRSEHSWAEANEPRASVALAWHGDALNVTIDVAPSERTFVAPGAVNRYDNEPAEINGDSVQLYVRDPDGRRRGWLLVPIAGTHDVFARAIDGWESSPPPRTRWSPTPSGYRLELSLVGEPPLALDVIVNEMPRGRERRRGQLVLSGGAGEFVYLRGDRHEASRLVRLQLIDA